MCTLLISSRKCLQHFIDHIFHPLHQSIDTAHRNLRPGRIFINKGQLIDSNLNRSPHSYMNNPEEERNRFVCADVLILTQCQKSAFIIKGILHHKIKKPYVSVFCRTQNKIFWTKPFWVPLTSIVFIYSYYESQWNTKPFGYQHSSNNLFCVPQKKVSHKGHKI